MNTQPTPAPEPKVEQWMREAAEIIVCDRYPDTIREAKRTAAIIAKHYALSRHAPPTPAPTERVREAVEAAIRSNDNYDGHSQFVQGTFNEYRAVERVLAALAPHLAALTAERDAAVKKNDEHAEDWAMCGMPHGSLLEKSLVLADQNRKLTAENAALRKDSERNEKVYWLVTSKDADGEVTRELCADDMEAQFAQGLAEENGDTAIIEKVLVRAYLDKTTS